MRSHAVPLAALAALLVACNTTAAAPRGQQRMDNGKGREVLCPGPLIPFGGWSTIVHGQMQL